MYCGLEYFSLAAQQVCIEGKISMIHVKPISVYLLPIPKKELSKADSAVEIDCKVAESAVKADGKSAEKSTLLRNRRTDPAQKENPRDEVVNSADDQANQKAVKAVLAQRTKFIISGWRFVNFSITSIIGLILLSKEHDWMLNPVLYFKGFEFQTMSPLLKLFYKIGYASYAYGTLNVFIEPKQKDFNVMVTHHITTLFLIHMSFMTGLFRIGAVILLIHEVSDPFMEIAKIFFYLNYKQVADVFFALFAVVFIITRNIIFPYYVISSLPRYGYHDDGRAVPYGKKYIRDIAFGSLCCLEVLHIYWAALILKMVKLAVSESGVQGDIRNEDD